MIKTKWYAKLLYLLVAVVLSLALLAVPGNILGDGVTILFEDFDGGLPDSWTVVNNAGDCVWRDDDPEGRGPLDGCDGTFMIADSDYCGIFSYMNTELQTPSINCSGYSIIVLEFDHYFLHWPPYPGKADVDISTDGGANWTNILAYGSHASGHVSVDISAVAAGESDVRVRWHYYNASYVWFWEVDNVKLSGTRVLVGGEAYPIDKTSVLALWIGLGVLLVGGMSWYALRRRSAHS